MRKKKVDLVKLDGRSSGADVREKFVTWLALPTELRDPPTQKEWSAQNGVDPATCWRWRQRSLWAGSCGGAPAMTGHKGL